MRDCKNWRLDPGRTNFSLGESPAIPFVLLWKTRISGEFSPAPSLDKIGNRLFFIDTAWGEDHASLHCFDSETGKENWRFQNQVPGTLFLGGVGEETAVLCQEMEAPAIIGVNLRDGSIAWRIDHIGSGARFGGVIDGGEIILPATDSANAAYVCKIDHKTGNILAQFKIPFYGLTEITASRSTICGIIVTEEKTASEVVALSRTTGEILWTTDVLSLDDAAYGRPDNTGVRDLDGLLMAENQVFVTQFSGKLWCLDERTGAPRWSYASHQGYLNVPAYADQKLYFRKWEHFIRLDANSGKEDYAVKHNGHPTASGQTSGTVAGDYFFFSDSLSLFALDRKDGRERWRHDYGKKKTMVWAPCLVSDGKLYVTGLDNYVYCFGIK